MRSSIYGLDVELDDELPPALTDSFPRRVTRAASAVALRIRPMPEEPTLSELSAGRAPTFESPTRHTSALSALRFWDFPQRPLLWFTGIAGFWLGEEEIGVVLHDADQARAAGVHLLGTVLPFWLARRGRSALHAAAVAVRGRAVVLAGDNGAGKTTLAAALLSDGHPLLTDDVVVIREEEGAFRAQPAVPWMRMWPEAAQRWTGRSPAQLERVLPTVDKVRIPIGAGGFGAFCDHPCPIARILLPTRVAAEAAVRIEEVPVRQVLIELIRHSSVPRLVEAAKLASPSFERWATLAERVPCRRVTVPADFDRLPEVTRALLDDLAMET